MKMVGKDQNVVGPRIVAIKGKRITRTSIRNEHVEYYVQWETCRGKCHWVSRKILANAKMCSTQASLFLLNYEEKVFRRIKRRKHEEKSKAATMIQKYTRRFLELTRFKRICFHILRLQCICRGRHGRLEARRRRLLLERKREKLEKFSKRNNNPTGEFGYGNVSAVLRDAYMAVCNEGKYSWQEKNVPMWKCLSCSFENESNSTRCELCLRKPSVSNKLLQLGRLAVQRTFQPKKSKKAVVKRHTFFG